jgi:hypothetical protein
MMGVAAQGVDAPFQPIPYRVGSLNNVAQVNASGQGWPWSVAPIASLALISIPANGMSVALMFEAIAGRMDILSWGLQGSSAV